jgi:hypothetical protein
MADTREWLQKPVWVTGLMRSGTTLLLSLFDHHPELVVYPDEPSFPRLFQRRYQNGEHLYMDLLYGTANPLHLNASLQNTPYYPPSFNFKKSDPIDADLDVPAPVQEKMICNHRALRGIAPERLEKVFSLPLYLKHLEQYAAGRPELTARDAVMGSIRAFQSALTDKPEAKRWLFKQPMGSFKTDRLQWFWDHFPQGRMVVIVRDPRGQYASMVKYLQKRGEAYGARRSKYRFVQTLRKLAASYTELGKLKDSGESGPLIKVFYEDLVTDTSGVMQRLATFLDIAYDDILTRPTRLGVDNAVVTGRPAFGAEVSREALEAWAQELTPLEIKGIEAWTASFFDAYKKRYARGYRRLRLLLQAQLCFALYLPALRERAASKRQASA